MGVKNYPPLLKLVHFDLDELKNDEQKFLAKFQRLLYFYVLLVPFIVNIYMIYLYLIP